MQVNTEENPHLAQRFGIRGIPAFHLIRQGKSIATLSGARPIETLVSWFNSNGA